MLSIVIPTFNEGAQVEALLWQLQSVTGVAQVVVVDASDDAESLQRVALLPVDDFKFSLTICPAARKGRAAQLNQGIKLCDQPHLLCLHCDTVIPSDSADRIAEALCKYQWGRFDVRLDASGFQFRMIELMINLRSRLTKLATGDQGMFFDSEFLSRQNGFADIALMEDVELCKRLGKRWPPALVKSKVTTSARRWQQHGTWHTIFLMWKLRFLYALGVEPNKLALMYEHGK